MPSMNGYQRQSQQQRACYGCGCFQHWRSQCPFSHRPAMPCQNQNKTEFIKDKNSLITSDINTKLELSVYESDNLTHDYFEYEQGQANIIAKDKLTNHYSFWKSIGCYD